MTKQNIGLSKEKGIRIEEDVKLDLKLIKSMLPAQMWGRKIEGDGDVVRVLTRLLKEKKIGELLNNSPSNLDTFTSDSDEFKDLQWRCINAEKLLEQSQKRFTFLCNLTGTDPKVIYEKFARR